MLIQAGSYTYSSSEEASCFIEGDRRLNDGMDDMCLQMGHERRERERERSRLRRQIDRAAAK